jgi:putative tryptophan/tyrosine transport system substrate-binding protein
MSARSPEDSARELAAFRKGLEQNGLTEGRNLKVEYRWAHGDYSRLPALAAELVRLQVGVLLAVGGELEQKVEQRTLGTTDGHRRGAAGDLKFAERFAAGI